MKFKFDETTDYGQDILELVAMVNELMDPDRIYCKKDVIGILRRISSNATTIKTDVMCMRGDGYFTEGDEISDH